LTAAAALLLFLLVAAQASVADGVRFEVAYAPGDKFKITERSDLRRYEDARFVGLSYREVRGVLDVRAAESAGGSGAEVEGSFYVFEETRRDARLVSKRIDDVVPVRFSIRADGTYEVPPDQPYPALRSFPVFPSRGLSPGDRWEAFGVRVVEPFRDGKHTRVRIYAGYEYQGPVVRDGRNLQLVSARYALRYKGGDDPLGDPRIRSISGSHSAKIYFDEGARRPVFVETLVDEAYAIEGGKSVGFKGFILTWYDGIAAMDRGLIAEDVKKALGPELARGVPSTGTGPAAAAPEAPAAGRGDGAGAVAGSLSGEPGGTPGVKVSETDAGVKLEISDIRFVADQAVVLPEEKPRLEAVARALRKIPGRTFRVIGHTARAGTEAGQKALSVERARAVVDFLVASGLDAGRFVYEGRGATEPVASNDTPQGMALNRRVEIIILED
jgi:outer membrane protein OmpA-like peptidoglycan-associated protein